MEDVFEIAYNSAAELNKAIKSNVEFGIVDLQYCCFGLINNKYFGEELKCQEEWEQRLLLAKIKNRLLYNGNIYLLPFYERVDKYLYNLYKEYKDNQKIKEVTQHLLELIRPYYNNLHQPPDKLAEIRIAKYKYIIDTYDYFLEIERENKELSYSYHSDIIEWDIEYYLSLLEQIVTDVLCYVEYEICDKYDLCFEEIITQSNMNIFLSKIDDNRQNDAQRSNKLPPELSTSEAMEIWKKAQKAGLVDEQYKWLETKVLLACFAKEMSDRFNLGKGTNSDGSKRINWKIFENLFDILGLRGALNDLKKTGEDPLNINLVNDIFK